MPTPERSAKIEAMNAARLPGVIVVLEDITDPHNAAAILRTCDGLGIGAVWYLFDTVESYDPKSIGKLSSSTANKWVNTKTFTDRNALESELKVESYISMASTIHEPWAVELWDGDFTDGNIAVWVGNEHTGLSEAALLFCEQKITIPMRGMVESFNVSVAAALILAEITRQRRV